MAALLVVAIGHAMSPPRVLPCEKIHPFHPKGTSFGAHFVPLFLSHSTRPNRAAVPIQGSIDVRRSPGRGSGQPNAECRHRAAAGNGSDPDPHLGSRGCSFRAGRRGEEIAVFAFRPAPRT